MRRTGEAIKDRAAFVNAFFKLCAQFHPAGPDEFQQRFSGIALAELTPAGKDAANATLSAGFFSPDPVKVEFRLDDGQWKIEGMEPVDPNAEPQFAVLRDVKRRRGLVHIIGRVASPEYALHGGSVTRAFVAVFADTRADDERLALEKFDNDRFSLDLPPGKYILQFTASGSGGASFNALRKPVELKLGARSLDLGMVELRSATLTRLYGRPIPELATAAKWRGRAPITFSQLRGKVVLVDVWSYHSYDCLQSHATLAQWAKQYEAQGLVVITVHVPGIDSFDELDKKLKVYPENVRQPTDELPVVLDVEGTESFLNTAGVTTWPTTLLADRDGKIVRRFGAATDPELIVELEKALRPADSKSQRVRGEKQPARGGLGRRKNQD
jgi:thiol-disulfide isomerase/thioredoxin